MSHIDKIIEREFAKKNDRSFDKSRFVRCYGQKELRALLQEVHDAAVAEAGRDAERYRWLRDIGDETWTPFVIHGMQTAKSVDAWIDAAIAAAKEK